MITMPRRQGDLFLVVPQFLRGLFILVRNKSPWRVLSLKLLLPVLAEKGAQRQRLPDFS
jgi:hypothetical protein